jgi:hypothetical protein
MVTVSCRPEVRLDMLKRIASGRDTPTQSKRVCQRRANLTLLGPGGFEAARDRQGLGVPRGNCDVRSTRT